MSTLVRSDGTQFVMQAYRELLSVTKRSQIVHEIRFLAEQQGQYTRLFKKGQNQYEAIFSTEPGYLLGESVWHYFGEPNNIIYCEALPDSAQILVVVVRSGSVYIDAQILGSSLQSELLPLMTGDFKYRIITSGNVPLRKAESFGTFRFPKDLIASFETLQVPLFPQLPALKSLQLQPLPLALKSEHLSFGFSTPLILLTTLALIFGGWWALTPKEEGVSFRPPLIRTMVSPYAAYYRALTTPAPDRQLAEMVATITQLYLLPGWSATKLQFNGKRFHVALRSDGGKMSGITQWAKQRGYQFHLSSRGAEVIYQSRLTSRAKPTALYASTQVVTQLVDHMTQLLHHNAVSLGETRQRGDVRATRLTIHLDEVSPELLDLVGRELNHLPLALTSVDITIHSGLMNGIIQLSVWGK